MRYLFILLFTLLALPVIAAGALAQPASSCDPQIMDAIESKAWLHGQRRVSQNANLIYMQDSVLEYSCFNQFIGRLAAGPGRRFSEGDGPAGVTSSNNPLSLDIALIQTSFLPATDYLQANFSHTFLGGRTPAQSGGAPSFGSYTCNAMEYVWKLARCMNFMDDSTGITNYDGFYDFPFYATQDPRILPPEIAACTGPGGTINTALTSAYNGDEALFTLNPENPNDATVYETDPIVTHLPLILPGNCALSAKVPTGVAVDRKDIPLIYDENVCSIPACSYDAAADECVL